MNGRIADGLRRFAAPAAVLVLATACARLPGPARDEALALRVMTFNVRYDEPRDGPNAWPRRKDLVAGTVSFHAPDVAGLQEVLAPQLADLRALLPAYEAVGVGRDDGREAGEFNPVLFRKARFRLLASSTFWLSERPDEPGRKGWDAACARIVTWARLRDRWTGRTVVVFNTHFDHVGETARRESAALVLASIARIASRDPFVLTGDFNSTREDAAYRTLLAARGGGPRLRDARDLSAEPPYGPPASFNGFRAEPASGLPIDHILVGPGFAATRTAILPATVAGRFLSDHNPVVADLRLARR
ncbi:MAG: endonuclease/exonuclease/phosphatase family protein [Acidobacteria bacterium]|nr:endonuclease/exonuclease/phosphatase family protein [Acidobacteriota bacterium]